MHPFLILREKISPLQFDPKSDVDTVDQEFLQSYLAFYQLNFSKNICSKHCIGTFENSGYAIVAQYWLPATQPKGTIFILHGYYDHVALFRHAIQFVLEQGYIAVAYDQPGHGLSSGEQVSIRHFSEYVHVLQSCLLRSEKYFTQPWSGMGQSTGGAVLLHALMLEKIPCPFKSIVLLAPLIRPTGWNLGVWTYRLLKPFVKRIPRHFAHNSNDKIFVSFCRDQDPLQSRYLSVAWVGAMKEWLEKFPLLAPMSINGLLIQGQADQTVDWHYNLQLLKEKVTGLEYYLLPDARHHLVNEKIEIRQQVFARIKQFLLASTQCEK